MFRLLKAFRREVRLSAYRIRLEPSTVTRLRRVVESEAKTDNNTVARNRGRGQNGLREQWSRVRNTVWRARVAFRLASCRAIQCFGEPFCRCRRNPLPPPLKKKVVTNARGK